MAQNPPYGDKVFWWDSILLKPRFRLPSLKTYLSNLKRLILTNQSDAFNIVSADEGITLFDFVDESIHYGLVKDLNAQALYLIGKIKSVKQTGNLLQQVVEIKTVATTGPMDTYDQAYQTSLCLLTGISYIYQTMDERELTLNWREPRYCPNISWGDETGNPQVTVITAELGAIPELTFSFVVTGMANRG